MLKLPQPASGNGEDDGTDPQPVVHAGAYQHVGPDALAEMREETIGAEGMKIDRMLFDKFADTVRADENVAEAVEAGQWDRVIDYVNREVFDKPEEYYSLAKLRKAAEVDRRLTLREILEKVFDLIPRFKSKDELLEDEFAKFVADHKPERARVHSGHQDLLQGLRHQRLDPGRHRQAAIRQSGHQPGLLPPGLQGRAQEVPRPRSRVHQGLRVPEPVRRIGESMLDADTKRRIDTARDILVGKVPDPKSQVEQITIALIYKFMDDMDAESEELGGARKFFTGEFVRYGWAKLMRSGLGGHETLNLYAEAIERMPENPGIPALFRDIFNNAYLPYRDPETLRAFLKVIDEFSYDHSERLGDAFEYLLSVLGSQGDAGQFRTPRHIIDFIVAVIDPKKDEAVLDPACGTAGFLISSYKHIVAANTGDDGSTLTPEEKGRLAANFKGYDISPDMVRLSLANMYLHGFVDPHIFEYDTLTSEERWNERADVILANPPFMSPKGGIRPHNRVLGPVQAQRGLVRGLHGRAPDGRRAVPASSFPRASSSKARTPTPSSARCWSRSIWSPSSRSPQACSNPTPESRPHSSSSTRPWRGGQTTSPSSRSKTTASTSATNAAPSRGTTCRGLRPISANTCVARGRGRRWTVSSLRWGSSWRSRRLRRTATTT